MISSTYRPLRRERDLQVLFVGGPPGSGKTTVAKDIERQTMPNNFGNHWTRVAAWELHTPVARRMIARGEAVRDDRTWGRWARTVENMIWAWHRADVLVLFTGTFLRPSIRRRVIEFGHEVGEPRRLNHYMVWLHADGETARRRLQGVFDATGESARHPRVFDKYTNPEIYVPPVTASGLLLPNFLNPSTERNVFILDANSERFSDQTDLIFEGIPGLRDYRVRAK